MIATSELQVDLRTAKNVVGVAPRTAVGIPPSDVDSDWDKIRVAVGGRIILRAFDVGDPVVTGAPIGYVTLTGEQYVTLLGDPYVTKVSM